MLMNLLPKESVGSIFRVLCLIGCLTPSVAKAGFDWTPPRAAPSIQHAAPAPQDAASTGPLTPEPEALPVPVGNVESAPVARIEPAPKPFVAENPRSAPISQPVSTFAPAPVVEELPAPVPASLPAPAPVTSPVPTTVSDAVVEGFGKDLPLAMALRDIVPPQYAYSFSPRDIAGVKISWRGGKPWQDVLKDALAPYDLGMSIDGKALAIFSKQYSISSPSAALPVPAQAMIAAQPTPESASVDPLPLVTPPAPPTRPEPTATSYRTTTAMDVKATRKWEARPGTTLRQTLESWTKDANVELSWSTPYDYPISNAFYFDGDFAQAVDSLLSSYGGENPSPKGRLYPNLPEGPSVLMVN